MKLKQYALPLLGVIGLALVLTVAHAPPARADVIRASGQYLDQSLNGTPVRLGVIAATTTINNHDTATAFSDTGNALEGKTLLVTCSAAANVNFAGTANTVTASATVTNAAYGVPLAAGERVIVTMARGYKWIAVVGTANCTVWELM